MKLYDNELYMEDVRSVAELDIPWEKLHDRSIMISGATGMIGSFLVMLILLQLASARFMPVAYPWSRHCLMWVVAAGIVACVFPLELGWTSAALKLLALTCITALPLLFGAVRVADLRTAGNTLHAMIR